MNRKEQHFPNTIPELAKILRISVKELRHFLYYIDKHVIFEYQLKPKGDYRKITKPSKRLKLILRRLNDEIFKKIPLHPLLFHQPGKSHIDLIKKHIGKGYILTADIDDFYPSVHINKLKESLKSVGFSDKILKTLTRITTVDYSLPQGFPTSPYLAAIILEPVISRLDGLSKKTNLTIGLYADNLAVSSTYNPQYFKRLLIKIFKQNSLSLGKFEIMTHDDQQVIMNVIVQGKIIKVKTSYIETIKKELNDLSLKPPKGNMRSTMGKIRYVYQINKEQADNILKYGKKVGVIFN